MQNINKEHYNRQYKSEIELKYKTNTRWLLSLVDKLLKNISIDDICKILDIGCGSGIITSELSRRMPNAKVQGVDLSDVGISQAKAKYSSIKNLSFYCTDAMSLATDDENASSKYDLLTFFEVLEHIEDWTTMLSATLEKYEPQYVIISSPIGRMRDYEKNVGHYRNYQKGELESFMKNAGYEAIDCYYAGFPFWSPICRDMLNVFRKDVANVQQVDDRGGVSLLGKIISVILYYLFRYCSFLRKGDQFVGLFRKREK